MAAADLPKKAANLLPKTKQWKTQNLTSMAATAHRFSKLLNGIWRYASEMSTPKSDGCVFWR
jgi:hypothetical protein